MAKYMISDTTVYRVGTVAEVEALHEQLLNDPSFDLTAFSYKTKQIKQKGEVVEEYNLVTAKKVFNDEKEPIAQVDVIYTEKEFEVSFQ